jgi:hypothetical protein
VVCVPGLPAGDTVMCYITGCEPNRFCPSRNRGHRRAASVRRRQRWPRTEKNDVGRGSEYRVEPRRGKMQTLSRTRLSDQEVFADPLISNAGENLTDRAGSPISWRNRVGRWQAAARGGVLTHPRVKTARLLTQVTVVRYPVARSKVWPIDARLGQNSAGGGARKLIR